MNRRTFLHLLTATAAAAVADLRPRPEPTEVVTGSRWITSPEIVMTDYGRIVTNATDVSWAALEEPPRVTELDCRGVSAGRVRTRFEGLMMQGMNREQAYMQAVLEEGERIMEST